MHALSVARTGQASEGELRRRKEKNKGAAGGKRRAPWDYERKIAL